LNVIVTFLLVHVPASCTHTEHAGILMLCQHW